VALVASQKTSSARKHDSGNQAVPHPDPESRALELLAHLSGPPRSVNIEWQNGNAFQQRPDRFLLPASTSAGN
jgi:hypothetical protein